MKILIADDHLLFREGLRHVLQSLAENVDVIEAGTREQTLDQVRNHADLDLVLLDLVMPGANGFDALEKLSREHPTLPIVVLSASDRVADMRLALDSGALGFVPKSSSAAVMLSAVKLVLAGGMYVPPDLLETGRRSVDSAAGQPTGELTARQWQVLRGIVDGKPNKIISSELNVSEATVKAHVTGVLKALNVSNRTQAALAGRRLLDHH